MVFGVRPESKRTLEAAMEAKNAKSGPSGRNKVTIKIPRELYERIRQIIDGTGFGSVTEFVVYVLRDLAAVEGVAKSGGLSGREVDLIRQRLRALGYLD
jgi:Arc/MetJ-type ribon-helix-helix transcriptional regulator